MHDYDAGSDDDDKGKSGKSGRALKEFDCPTCNANNPTDEPIKNGDEIRCHYCGNDFLVTFTDSGRMKFKEL